MQQVKKSSKVSNKRLLMVIAGVILVAAGFGAAVLFLNSQNSYVALLGVAFWGFGGYLFYKGIKGANKSTQGYLFTKSQSNIIPEKPNCIGILAKRNPSKPKDIPVKILFFRAMRPKGALHYVRNQKKHFYVNINDTIDKKMNPLQLPDKKYSSPGVFVQHSNMQQYRDAIEFNPPSLIQKIAPWILLAAMFIVGILMVMTGPESGG